MTLKPMKPKTVRIWTVDVLRRAYGDHFEAPKKNRAQMAEDGALLMNPLHRPLHPLARDYFESEYMGLVEEFMRIINGQPRRRRTWEWKRKD